MKLKKACLTTLAFLSLISLASCKKKKASTTNNTDAPIVTVENDKKYQIYLLAQSAGFSGTYEEWLASIKGNDGKGIKSIEKTNSEGLVDTFTITFTDDTTTTFTITNGSTDNIYVSVSDDDDDETVKEIIEIDGKKVIKTYQKFVGEWINTRKYITEHNNKREFVAEELYDWDEENNKWDGRYKYDYEYNGEKTTTFYYNWIDSTNEWKLDSKDIDETIEGTWSYSTITESYDYDLENNAWLPSEKVLTTYDNDDCEVQYIHYAWAKGINDWSEDEQRFSNEYFNTTGTVKYDWAGEDNGWVNATMKVKANLYRDEDILYEYVILTLKYSETEKDFVLYSVEEKYSEDGDTISYNDNPGSYGNYIWQTQYHYSDTSNEDDCVEVVYDYMFDLEHFAIRPYRILEREYVLRMYGYENNSIGYSITISEYSCSDWDFVENRWANKEIVDSVVDDYGKVESFETTKYKDGIEEKFDYCELSYDEYDRYVSNVYYCDWDEETEEWTTKYHNTYEYDESGRYIRWTQAIVNDDNTETYTYKSESTYDDINEEVISKWYAWYGESWVED